MPESRDNIPPMKTLGGHFREALKRTHENRPTSFYMLLAVPAVMVLGVPLAGFREDPKHFAFMLAIQFVFLGIIFLRAVFDVFEIGRRILREDRKNFKETLGDEDFVSELASRVKKESDS
mgnify:CR=1 FL=1